MFQFKQFAVDQSGCAMKINTDGVLLGALSAANKPAHILDIGTGTGVVALMLAQRFANALVDAVEIDGDAAATAATNFLNSKNHERMFCYYKAFKDFFSEYPEKRYDLIVSNPPFYINSLKSPGEHRSRAKHADENFFDMLIGCIVKQLRPGGLFWMILPADTSALVKDIAAKAGLYVSQLIAIQSFPETEPHRQLIAFSLTESYLTPGKFVIYQSPKVYTEQYKTVLRDFFTIF